MSRCSVSLTVFALVGLDVTQKFNFFINSLDSDFTSGIIRSFTDALQTSLAFKTKLVSRGGVRGDAVHKRHF